MVHLDIILALLFVVAKQGRFYHLHFGGGSAVGGQGSLKWGLSPGKCTYMQFLIDNQHIITKFSSKVTIRLTKNFTWGWQWGQTSDWGRPIHPIRTAHC